MTEQPHRPETRFLSKSKPQTPNAAKDDKSGKTFEMRLMRQLDDFNSELKSTIQDMHNILLAKLDTIVADFNRRFEDVNKSISALTVRIEVLEQTSESVLCSQLTNEISTLQNKIDSMERDKLCSDAILHGVPMTADEDLNCMYSRLCTAIECTPAPVPKEIFRTKPKGNLGNSAIIIKFSSVADKIAVLRSANTTYRKTKKRICLHQLGLQSDKPISINESLTAPNIVIFRKAHELKKLKQLFSVFTRGGRVYARQTSNGRAFLVDSIQHLDSLAAATTYDDAT